jgi:hypothetical protein
MNRKLRAAAVGIEPSSLLQTRKLFIPHSGKTDRNGRNGEATYKKGTRRHDLQKQIGSSWPLLAFLAGFTPQATTGAAQFKHW